MCSFLEAKSKCIIRELMLELVLVHVELSSRWEENAMGKGASENSCVARACGVNSCGKVGGWRGRGPGSGILCYRLRHWDFFLWILSSEVLSSDLHFRKAVSYIEMG